MQQFLSHCRAIITRVRNVTTRTGSPKTSFGVSLEIFGVSEDIPLLFFLSRFQNTLPCGSIFRVYLLLWRCSFSFPESEGVGVWKQFNGEKPSKESEWLWETTAEIHINKFRPQTSSFLLPSSDNLAINQSDAFTNRAEVRRSPQCDRFTRRDVYWQAILIVIHDGESLSAIPMTLLVSLDAIVHCVWLIILSSVTRTHFSRSMMCLWVELYRSFGMYQFVPSLCLSSFQSVWKSYYYCYSKCIPIGFRISTDNRHFCSAHVQSVFTRSQNARCKINVYAKKPNYNASINQFHFWRMHASNDSLG